MNNSSVEATVSWLVDCLDLGGLIGKLELGDEDIADILWLAARMRVLEANYKESKSERPEVKPKSEREISQEDSQKNRIVDSKLDKVMNVYPEPTIKEQLKTSPDTRSLTFQAPAAPAIQNSLQISRALRPLMKKFPSARKRVVDEEATGTRIAERDIFIPVIKPELERWLDLELIVEQSRSSLIWQETIDEFKQILEIHGAFRSVRVWTLSNDRNQLQLFRRKKGKRTSNSQHSYRELIHSDRRGLVLLVSDCVSSIWQQGEIHHWLQQWSQKQPTAIVQLFPERMWDSTQLGVGRKFFSSALTPGVTNPKLILENLPAWIPIDWQQALVLPVINLEPEILKQWSGVVAGSGKARISTYLFDLDFVTQQAKSKQTKPEVKTETSSQTAEDINLQKEREAEIIIKRFLATASITAQRLAGMMAAAPVDMRVVNLIRQTLLPEARPVHVAEVYMGGILESKDEGESRIYQFQDGVRGLLNKAMAQYETTDVLDTISRYIAEELDRPIRSFTALLALLPTYSEAEKEQILPFAKVAVEVLENLGGQYAEFATQVSASINTVLKLDSAKEEEEIFLESELKIFTFDVATYFESELEICTFQVATIEKGLSNGKNIKWLFQGNPKYYRMLDAIRDLEEVLWPVKIKSYFEQMAVEDVVLIWVSGKEAGIYAIAEIVELLKESQEVPDIDYWIDTKVLDSGIDQPKARLCFTTKLLKKPLLKEKLKQDDILKDLLIIRNPRFARTKVTPEESKRIYKLIEGLDPIIKTKTKQTEYYTEDLGNEVGLDMIYIPHGSFTMGAPKDESESRDNERPQHLVNVPTFFMGKYPITQEQWQEVMGNNPSEFKGDKRPVENISWSDAREFCVRLTQLTNGEYRLPSEAEWEYACRAGTNTPFHHGKIITTEFANYNGNSVYGDGIKGEYRKETTEVGEFFANEFGLYDMHGNVWEWCEDDWYQNYEGAPTDGGTWRISISNSKVLRGGSWDVNPSDCRSACRGCFNREAYDNDIGFRVLCVVSTSLPKLKR